MRLGICYPSTLGIPAARRTFRGLMFSKTSGQLRRERAHAKSPPLGSPSAHKAQRDVHATGLLRSHATSTLGSCSVRKETCSIERTAAFLRREHTWISVRAQARTHVHAIDCCVRTPQAHLDLALCAKRHVPAKRLLRSHAASTLGSRSVRKETCSIEKTAAISRCPPR